MNSRCTGQIGNCCSPMTCIISIFILTLSLHTIAARSVSPTQAAKTQTAASAVVSGSANADKVAGQESLKAKSLLGEKQSVMDHPTIIDNSQCKRKKRQSQSHIGQSDCNVAGIL